MLKRAVRCRLIQCNPLQDCDRPRLQQAELNVLTETEIARLWSAYTQLERDAEDEEQKAWWRLARTITFVALGTALRRGELLALRQPPQRSLRRSQADGANVPFRLGPS
jgi:integrase